MNKIKWLIACNLFLVLVLWVPSSSFAQSPFDGTWLTNPDKAELSPMPEVFSVNNGMYECSSCKPKINVKADGQDQPITGRAYDSISVREVDAKSIVITTKKGDKTVNELTRTVSADGNTLTARGTLHSPGSDQTTSSEATFMRLEKAPAGANSVSGSWRMTKFTESGNGVATTYRSNGDELSMSTSAGESYSAKLDGKDYPRKGSYFFNSVSLKRIDDRTIEEANKRDGQLVEVAKMTVAPDGKTMTVVATNKLNGRTSTFRLDKQ